MQSSSVTSAGEADTATETQVINEEYKIWKKNTPFLYDTVITHALTWPSLTCQWLPDQETPKDADYTVNRMIIGTHTSSKATDQLMIAEVLLPKPSADMTGKEVAEMYDEDKQEIGSHTKSPARIRVTHTINHEGEVNRARYMPQNPDLIATRTPHGDVLVFDRTKHETKAPAMGDCKPDIRLVGLTGDGFGLAWSKVNSGHIVSGGEDMVVAHWDINSYNKKDPILSPVTKYRGHMDQINDVDWHQHYSYMFGSVSDDRCLFLYDIRVEGTKCTHHNEAHDSEVNTLAFAPSSEYLVLTGSADKTVALWDIRKISHKLHSFEAHTDNVLQVAWSPFSAVHFASAAEDRRIHIWNLDSIGAEQTPDDAEDGPPELMFVHGGHTGKPTDISWSPSAKWHIASTSEDNVLQVWEPSRHLRAAGEADVNAMDLE